MDIAITILAITAITYIRFLLTDKSMNNLFENKLNTCLIGFSVLEIVVFIVSIIGKLNSDLDLICHLHYFVYLL